MQPQRPENIQLPEVEQFLRERGWPGVRAITHVGHGEWSMAFNFSSADKTYVVRFSAFEEDFGKDQFAARWACPELPIPRVLELGQAFDGFYAVAERVDGDYLNARSYMQSALC